MKQRDAPAHVLPDVLASGLDVVFCGSAVGAASARIDAYYAGPGNKFWPILHQTGLTPSQLDPRDLPDLRRFGIGLTDMAKTESGSDASLSKQADDAQAVRDKIERFQPRALAFNGKRAGRVFFNGAQVGYGQQSATIGRTAIFVLPSTSGLAVRFWDEGPWVGLATFLGRSVSNGNGS